MKFDTSRLPERLQGHVLVAGAGVSGQGCARLLHSLGVQVSVADDNAASLATLPESVGRLSVADAIAAANAQAAHAQTVMGDKGPAAFGLVVTSPGWRPDSALLRAFAESGVEVIGDVELAYRLDRAEVFGPARTWLVVTGTNGKTTTTGMLTSIMQADAARTGRTAWAVGNIGVSVFDALAAAERVDVLCAELSSFQLHWSAQLRPQVGALLNLAEDHIDWHGSFAHYADSKAKALAGDIAVVGIDDSVVAAYVPGLPGKVVGFRATEPQAASAGGCAGGEVGVAGDRLVYQSADGAEIVDFCSAVGIEPAGVAGLYDAAAAAAVAYFAGAAPESIAAGLGAYRVSGHRGAVVHEDNGVRFVDNSKATNPHAADAALAGLDNVVWVAGGQLKGADVAPLVQEHYHRFRAAVLLGCDQELIAAALTQFAPDVPVTRVEETDPVLAMAQAVRAARQHAEPGDTVLLAPAAASLDMYTGMGQRGDLFAAAARDTTSTR